MVSPGLQQTMNLIPPPNSGYSMKRYRQTWSMNFGEEVGDPAELCLLDWTDPHRAGPISPVDATVNFVMEDIGILNKSKDKQEVLMNKKHQIQPQGYCMSSIPETATERSRSKHSTAVLGRVRRLLSQPRSSSESARMVELPPSCSVPIVDDDMRVSRRLFHVEDGPQARSYLRRRSPSTSPVRRSMSVNATASTLLPDRVENFHRALDDEIVKQAFAAFCRRTLSSENVDFVRQVRKSWSTFSSFPESLLSYHM